MSECLYRVLQVDTNATKDEIKKAYRKLSLQYHPDRDNGDKDEYVKIQNAYEVLSNDKKRMQYDVEISMQKRFGIEGMPFTSASVEINLEDLSNIMGLFTEDMPINVPLDKLGTFAGMFGGLSGLHDMQMHEGRRMNKSKSMPRGFESKSSFYHEASMAENKMHIPETLHVDLEVTLEQVYYGCTLPIQVTKKVVSSSSSLFSLYGDEIKQKTETIYVEIPQGTDDNEIIPVLNAGHVYHDKVGDIEVRIKLKNGTNMERQGLDLILKKRITLYESLYGFSFEIDMFGKKYAICNDEGNIIPPGHKKVIPRLGMKRNEHYGKLIIDFQVEFPTQINQNVYANLKILLGQMYGKGSEVIESCRVDVI